MILWRISNYDSLDGVGGLLVSGRRHRRGRPVLYLTFHPATALLETLVHMELDAADLPARAQVLKLETPDTVARRTLDAEALPEDWAARPDLTQAAGGRRLASRASLLLEVPSVLVPEASNVLANPMHPEADSMRIVKRYKWPLDKRLLKAVFE